MFLVIMQCVPTYVVEDMGKMVLKKFTAHSLMEHLAQRMKECPIHFGIKYYIKLKHDTKLKGGHKEFYEKGSIERTVASNIQRKRRKK